jgi:hypothetical protein
MFDEKGVILNLRKAYFWKDHNGQSYIMDKSEKLATVELYKGTPTIFLHGKPVFGTFLRTVTPTPEGFPNEAGVRHYAAAGIHFYSVDSVTSSYTYSFRGIGGEDAPMLPNESVRLHKKLHLYDDDTRTHLSLHAGDNYRRPDTLDDSLAILKRNFY